MTEIDFERWMMQCGIGERYWDSQWAQVRESADIHAYAGHLREFVDRGQGLVILGSIGVGKTSALSLIARAARDPGIKTWYTTVSKLIEHLLRGSGMKTLYNQFGLEAGNAYQVDPRTWPLLLLDEFGSAYENPYAMAALEDYVGWRYDHKFSTCVAANLTMLQIKTDSHYARMFDRWRQTSVWIQIGGESMRTRLGEEE